MLVMIIINTAIWRMLSEVDFFYWQIHKQRTVRINIKFEHQPYSNHELNIFLQTIYIYHLLNPQIIPRKKYLPTIRKPPYTKHTKMQIISFQCWQRIVHKKVFTIVFKQTGHVNYLHLWKLAFWITLQVAINLNTVLHGNFHRKKVEH